MKAVMISVNPKRCSMIAAGRVTLEIRKRRPVLPAPFKCFIFCTKGKENDPHELLEIHNTKGKIHKANGKVIGEFICDDCTPLCKHPLSYIEKHARVTKDELLGYWGISEQQNFCCEAIKGYVWHISALEIYDTPLELSRFNCPPETYCEKGLCGGCPFDQVADVNGEYAFDCEWRRPILRSPRSWCYVDDTVRKQRKMPLQEGEFDLDVF